MGTHFDAVDLLMRYETPLLKDMEKDDDVLEWVAAFVGSDYFQESIDAFCDTHAEKFKILLVPGGAAAEEIAASEPAWKDLHTQFVDTANSYIEGFLVEHGFTMDQYNARCEEETRLSEERQRHTRMSFFVQILMACTEYDQFLVLMRRAADPEYYEKKALQYEAERILYDDEQVSHDASSKQAKAAQEFLEYVDQNPSASLAELTQEFQRKVQIS